MKFKKTKGVLFGLCLTSLVIGCRKELSPFGSYDKQVPMQAEYKETIIVYFKDKNNSSFSLQEPAKFLTEKAIARRKAQAIKIDSTDLPVNDKYIQEVLKVSKGKLLNRSKWLNYVTIHLPEQHEDLKTIQSLAFVKSVKQIGVHIPYQEPVVPPIKKENNIVPKGSIKMLDTLKVNAVNYGKTYRLLERYQAQELHANKFYGNGKTIAILSEGFGYIAEKPEIAHLIAENRIIDQFDLLYNRDDISTTTTNGNNMLAMFAAIDPKNFVGLAPKAEYILTRTDRGGTQEPFFETSWVASVERADSLGVDIISSSCMFGVKFDQPQFDITEEHSDGRSISSQVADLAFTKGILTVQMFPQRSAGITFVIPPEDAKNILTVGNANRNNEPLWSILDKPTADGRIKPEFAVIAQEIPIIYGWGDSYNTAYSPPILAGLVACLWEAFPNKTSAEIKDLLIRSASQGSKPDNKLGYGVPNFKKAYENAK
ncbi:S8 family serine peptidase [Sphingobacterium sp. DK4209]|uniref:S8 family serine peptidase n=1 Tax=Sphingobacterium zhuxiongii TaxID=2662364 RepID=A0A5Q0QCG0_9SPHI|nr:MULTISPECIES: S8 family serine peptidase [unclassified Sphingobacterium]MVZ64645.1 S8 family serine peptidase [Sphingobacterium sp. DK4209]QGA26984.1 S8 family serine peptidase [Sphingobacterium sp. dk4302]